MKAIPISELTENMKLETVYMPSNMKTIKVARSEASRPGLQLTGFFKAFSYERLQVIGNLEIEYMNSLNPGLRESRLRKIFEYSIPAMIITGGHSIFPEILELAKEFNRPLFKSELPATKFISNLLAYLDDI